MRLEEHLVRACIEVGVVALDRPCEIALGYADETSQFLDGLGLQHNSLVNHFVQYRRHPLLEVVVALLCVRSLALASRRRGGRILGAPVEDRPYRALLGPDNRLCDAEGR